MQNEPSIWNEIEKDMLGNVIRKYNMKTNHELFLPSTLIAEMKEMLLEKSRLQNVRDELNNVVFICDFRISIISITNNSLFYSVYNAAI